MIVTFVKMVADAEVGDLDFIITSDVTVSSCKVAVNQTVGLQKLHPGCNL